MRFTRVWATGIAAAGLLLGVANPAIGSPRNSTDEVSASTPAVSQQEQRTYRQLFRSRGTQRCLASNSAGAVYTTSPCTANNASQVWYSDEFSPLRIWNKATGRCLSYSTYNGSGTGAVWTAPCNGSVWQQWRSHSSGWLSTWQHIPRRYLDNNSQGSVYTLWGSGSYNQLWERIYF